jgi:thiol-disulfide isomerase/thioredoxin
VSTRPSSPPPPDGEERPSPAQPDTVGRTTSAWQRLRRHLTLANLVTIAVLAWATPRLLPHLGAVVGVESGPATTPDYAFVSLDGAALSADSLRGKVVLVNFWATWCTPCRVEMPALQRMHERHQAEGFAVVGLAVDRASTQVVRDFVRARGVTYPIAHVGPEAEALFGGVRGYPMSFLLDRDGKIRHTVIGPVAPVSLEPAVRRLLAE